MKVGGDRCESRGTGVKLGGGGDWGGRYENVGHMRKWGTGVRVEDRCESWEQV